MRRNYLTKICTTLLFLYLTHLPFSHKGVALEFSDDQMDRFMWVDSTLSALSLDEKIGQLFMVRAHSDKGPDHILDLYRQVERLGVGGVCLFQGSFEGHQSLVQALNQKAKVPLLVSMDAEWGINMRLKEIAPFPKQMTLGAIADSDKIREVGRLIAQECQQIGVNMNFAPVVDVNNNPRNPVINYRSFGEDADRVAKLAESIYFGMNEQGVMACAKHFPGHGDTDLDSHHDLPVINKSYEQLDSIELKPFKHLVYQGIPAVMTAHLHLPELDSTENLPSSLSPRIVKDILLDSLNFHGLVVTDALEMQGVRKHFDDGEIAIRAFEAGNHILLLPHNIGVAIQAIKLALETGRISKVELNQRLRVILNNKYDYARSNLIQSNLDTNLTIKKDQLLEDLASSSICLLKNSENILPLHRKFRKIHHLALGTAEGELFSRRLSQTLEIHETDFNLALDLSDFEDRYHYSNPKDELLILSLHMGRQSPRNNYGISDLLIDQMTRLNSKMRLLVVYFGNPYGLRSLTGFPNLILAHENLKEYQSVAANAIAGFAPFNGILPVSLNKKHSAGHGLQLERQAILSYDDPENRGISSKGMDSIDQLMLQGIAERAFPSAVVLVARQGKIIHHQAYGYHTYKRKRKVEKQTVYDLASITKVAATTLCLMKLEDQGLISVEEPLGDHLPLVKGSDKENILILDILQHRAGLIPWIPFYEQTIESNRKGGVELKEEIYSSEGDLKKNTPIDGNHYILNSYRDSIYDMILKSEVFEEKTYRYSDIGFYLLKELIEHKSGLSLSRFFEQEFVKPLNLNSTQFNPWLSMDIADIPPTERDDYFRNQVVQGYVHDMGAAMLGGISGHAGLFSNAYDLAVIFQMLLDNGRAFDQQILSPETIKKYTKRYDDSRRGLGFDMKQLDLDENPSTHELVSDQCFGHYGFTGTAVWADPQEDLIYIFLSNRTYPEMNNVKINTLDIRRKIQAFIYRSILPQYES
jgi:beta-glucosidase-like glycosyl hydrolase/CubicO group peptidase (beta-lactamase class C family)